MDIVCISFFLLDQILGIPMAADIQRLIVSCAHVSSIMEYVLSLKKSRVNKQVNSLSRVQLLMH